MNSRPTSVTSNKTNTLDRQRMYQTWNLDHGFVNKLNELEIQSGIANWSIWRTKINDFLITSILGQMDTIKSQKNPFRLDTKLAKFIYYYGYSNDRPSLDPDSYMFRGIPRAKLRSQNITTSIDKNLESRSYNEIFINSNVSMKDVIDKNEKSTKAQRVVTGINVKEKVKVFENKVEKKVTKPVAKAKVKKTPTKTPEIPLPQVPKEDNQQTSNNTKKNDVLKAVDGDIIFANNNEYLSLATDTHPQPPPLPPKTTIQHPSTGKRKKEFKNMGYSYLIPLKNILRSKKSSKVDTIEVQRNISNRKSSRKPIKSKTLASPRQRSASRGRKKQQPSTTVKNKSNNFAESISALVQVSVEDKVTKFLSQSALGEHTPPLCLDDDIIDLSSSSSDKIQQALENSKHLQPPNIPIPPLLDKFDAINASLDKLTPLPPPPPLPLQNDNQSISSCFDLPPPPPPPPPPIPPSIPYLHRLAPRPPKPTHDFISLQSLNEIKEITNKNNFLKTPSADFGLNQVTLKNRGSKTAIEFVNTKTLGRLRKNDSDSELDNFYEERKQARVDRRFKAKPPQNDIKIKRSQTNACDFMKTTQKTSFLSYFISNNNKKSFNNCESPQLNDTSFQTLTVSHFCDDMDQSSSLFKTKPKTSKEILQEISRLTNGTSPKLDNKSIKI